MNKTRNEWWVNLTESEYLEFRRGPKRIATSILIPITVIYSIIFITGVIGNLLVCLVIKKNTSLHTATNYYLFSLSVSDLTFLLLGLPNDLLVFWKQYPWTFGETFCKVRATISEMTSYTSILTIVTFSMERYLAICHPLQAYKMSGLKRALKIVVCVWIVSLISSTPFVVFTTVNYIDYPPYSGKIMQESAFCGLLHENIPKYFPIYELSCILYFILPMIIIIKMYINIGRAIKTSSKNSAKKILNNHAEKLNSRRASIQMLMAVVVAFFFCWAPFHAQRIIYLYGRKLPHFYIINEWMYYITGCLYFISSTINPILYNLMSVKYRTAFKETLLRQKVPKKGLGLNNNSQRCSNTSFYSKVTAFDSYKDSVPSK